MSTVTTEPLLLYSRTQRLPRIRPRNSHLLNPPLLSFRSKTIKLFSNGASFCNFKPHQRAQPVRDSSTDAAVLNTFQSTDVSFKETFRLTRTQRAEGKIFFRLDQGNDQGTWVLSIGCNLPGKWILHWGVSHIKDNGSEWDQPPKSMRPPGSILIRDYAIETPLKKSSEQDIFYEVKIDVIPKAKIAGINFVLKDEETGAWYQHRGRDFKVPLVDDLQDDGNMISAKRGSCPWKGVLRSLLNIILKEESSASKAQGSISELEDTKQKKSFLQEFYEEQPITKEIAFENSLTVSVWKSPERAKNLLYMETDLPGDVIVHWGVCRDDAKYWEIPEAPYPPKTTVFKNKALRTLLQPKEGEKGCSGLFTLDEELEGFLFVLKLNESTWLKWLGNDFHIPLSGSGGLHSQLGQRQFDVSKAETADTNEEVSPLAYTQGITNQIRNLVSQISSDKSRKTKTKEAQESILQEIEKLAAEAYNLFRSFIPTFSEETVSESEFQKPSVGICSRTGSGFEILCQGFNWESHRSGKWYMDLKRKAAEISSMGFTVIWLPPPTESVSPEGYMPKDLYNLNSRYGSIHELKDLVKTLHEVGIKVLGDAVLNHRCAHYKNQNDVWNIFGGRLNWDDRAVVADDPHFQGKGNKSSGDNFHAAPNIDHSQDFVREDIKEWLCWLREEIGYDGWRLDFVRGFWGGYVKDYMDSSEPYFAVGEYWDSLSYTYGEMDHNQDAHRQRIIDWINAANGTAGAFDVTTKGILHSALERCEYWRLSDQKGKPPGVLGWWPSGAVTFIENHDTGSTQGHWRFPSGKEMQGYAYILTHPGTPAVFYDHIFSHYQSEIAALISVRNRNKIHCRSMVKIIKAERDVYAAIIDKKVVMKIGPGSFEPSSVPARWTLAIERQDYKVWETS
ncbi:alpha-amylase 3, chloroplastic-like [Tripterygium wilfordii]|uniref:alpha-amylase 3, chloroplastic-like n=1 Tax=Tripterygium wilfordii TaxID=458696 RepID=UPI0018F81D7E|nr:alpha-amylase 3, chloroplastic-like [Tripterygium wilfordii]